MPQTSPLSRLGLRFFTTLMLSLLALPALAQEADSDPFAKLQWRAIGPVNMSGRVADVESIPGDPNTVYVGAASGGVWKSTDAGMTFQPIFDEQEVASIGDIGIAPGNPEVLYVGTGEANVRNSVSVGRGVYRSTDGGEQWQFVGLEDSRHISRVLVSSHDQDTVFVGALGNIFGPSEQRGVFRSTDGGQSWDKTLYIDEYHGVSDMDIDPHNPNVLFAAMWRFERKPWTHRTGSEEGGIFKSTDGGQTWKRITKGLPKLMGRVGVKIAPSNPEVVYVIAESDEGTLFRSNDRGESFTKVTDEVSIVSRGLYYTDMRVDPADENRIYAVASLLQRSIDGGKTWQRLAPNIHIDFHAMWIDPSNPSRMWVGQDGGVAFSLNHGENWTPARTLPIGQFYQIFADQGSGPFYRTGGGLQDNGTWIGPASSRELAGVYTDDWHMFSFGDAYWVAPHPTDDNILISEAQGGAIFRTNLENRQQLDINPQTRRNDGGPVGDLEYRFNWNSPIIQSPHDPMTIYFGGNVVFKTTDFGDTWERISPDLTTNNPDKQGPAGGPAWYENTVAEWHTTLISLAESPHTAGMLWAGSDDGRIHLSRDDGDSWNEISRPSGIAEFSPVSHIEPSRTAEETVYIAFDRHMFDDLRPHIFRSENAGRRWTRITDGLPENAWVWVVREDLRNPNVLYAGTEFGLFVSHDRGDNWQELDMKNLPTVAVHDIVQQPRRNDLLLGTHGRAIWVFDDITPVQQWNDEIAEAPAHLFPVREAFRYSRSFTRYGEGDHRWIARNPAYGALLTYTIQPPESDEDSGDEATESADDWLTLEILNQDGEVIRTLEDAPKEAGMNRIAWDLSIDPPRYRTDNNQGGLFGGPPTGPQVVPGTYTARLTVHGETYEQPIQVSIDPALEVSNQALQAEYDAVAEVNTMLSTVNDRLRQLDALDTQLKERKQNLKTLKRELPEDAEQAWKDFAETLKQQITSVAREPGKPFWSLAPQLVERLSALSGGLNNQFRAPSEAQQSYLRDIRSDYQTAMSSLDEFFNQTLPAFNDMLANNDVPGLTAELGGVE
ncbi:MAG: hypothetical protein Tsb002_31570 [Wenzhouxiangellaceae bacterium]